MGLNYVTYDVFNKRVDDILRGLYKYFFENNGNGKHVTFTARDISNVLNSEYSVMTIGRTVLPRFEEKGLIRQTWRRRSPRQYMLCVSKEQLEYILSMRKMVMF